MMEATIKSVKKILITQPRPESDKSPYFDLARKYAVEMEFYPFIRLEPISSKEFRKQKIEIPDFSSVIFTSRNAIDHFFRICEEMKLSVSQDTKYFCITEAVALYLQKFILYRKRKVFYGADGTNKSLFDVINKHKENENFLYPCSENQQDNEIVNWLKNNKCEFPDTLLCTAPSAMMSRKCSSHREYRYYLLFYTQRGEKPFRQFPVLPTERHLYWRFWK